MDQELGLAGFPGVLVIMAVIVDQIRHRLFIGAN
jgi:hypothetical protein